MQMTIAGIDDSGRGPVIGPLVIAGVLADHDALSKLEMLRGKDSKCFSPKRRMELSRLIKDIALSYVSVEVPPAQIDKAVWSSRRLFKLNRLEAKAMAKAIMRLKPAVAYVDTADVNAERYGEWIREYLTLPVVVVSRKKADLRYPIVGAASIIAKVRRDQIVKRLHEKYGFFGSGYSSDPRTRSFLLNWFNKHGSFPPIARRSWKTLERIETMARISRTSLDLSVKERR